MTSLPTINRSIFISLCTFVFTSILYKLVNVPVTHDELGTVWISTRSTVWELITYKDPVPNNHILNSLLTKLVLSLTETTKVSIRIVNLLFFLVYAYGIFRISKLLFGLKSYFFIPASLIFLASPYLLDFFSVCRGYGMSAALGTLSLSFMISAYKYKHAKHIWLALLFATLGSYANFTLLYFWLGSLMLSIIYILIYRESLKKGLRINIIWLGFILVTYAALIVIPILRMSSTDQFQFWFSNGFYNDTVFPLVVDSINNSEFLFFKNHKLISVLAILIIAFNSIYVIYKLIKSESRSGLLREPIFIITSLMILTIIINNAHVFILNSPYLAGRLAIFYYPLFAANLIATFSLFSKYDLKKIKLGIAITVAFLSLSQLLHSWNPNTIREWYFDTENENVISYLKHVKKGEKLRLDTSWMFHPSFTFYKEFTDLSWLDLAPYQKTINPDSDAEYYYVMYYDMPELRDKLDIVLEFDTGGVLMKKK